MVDLAMKPRQPTQWEQSRSSQLVRRSSNRVGEHKVRFSWSAGVGPNYNVEALICHGNVSRELQAFSGVSQHLPVLGSFQKSGTLQQLVEAVHLKSLD